MQCNLVVMIRTAGLMDLVGDEMCLESCLSLQGGVWHGCIAADLVGYFTDWSECDDTDDS